LPARKCLLPPNPYKLTQVKSSVCFGGTQDSTTQNKDIRMTYVIAEPCVDILDKACVQECPVDCIYEGERSMYIQPDECVDCAACEPVCPVEAIFYQDDIPEEWTRYVIANVDFFENLGSPGGAGKIGRIAHDPPLIKSLPKRS
jgi:NAD-dependent dihydropyrimidine dehydrogenase PreA subunit